MTIVLPAIMALYDLYFLSGGRPGGLLRRWPLYATLAVLCLFFTVRTVAPLGGLGRGGGPGAGAPGTTPPQTRYAPIPALTRLPTAGFGVTTTTPGEYLLTESNVVLYYIALLVLPINQNIDYDFPVSRGPLETPRPARARGSPSPCPRQPSRCSCTRPRSPSQPSCT